MNRTQVIEHLSASHPADLVIEFVQESDHADGDAHWPGRSKEQVEAEFAAYALTPAP